MKLVEYRRLDLYILRVTEGQNSGKELGAGYIIHPPIFPTVPWVDLGSTHGSRDPEDPSMGP
jgi:hypothetical protein